MTFRPWQLILFSAVVAAPGCGSYETGRTTPPLVAVVQGRVTDEAGARLAEAAVEVSAAEVLGDGSLRTIATVHGRTDATGTYCLTLRVAGLGPEEAKVFVVVLPLPPGEGQRTVVAGGNIRLDPTAPPRDTARVDVQVRGASGAGPIPA